MDWPFAVLFVGAVTYMIVDGVRHIEAWVRDRHLRGHRMMAHR